MLKRRQQQIAAKFARGQLQFAPGLNVIGAVVLVS